MTRPSRRGAERRGTDAAAAAGTGPGGGAPAARAGGQAARVAPFAAVVAVVAVGILAFSSTLQAGFVFDDTPHIVDSNLVREPASFLPGRPGYLAQPNRALGNLTFALNRQWIGPDPSGFHAVNVLVHVLAALLVLALARVSFRTPRLSRSALAPWSGAVAFVAALWFVAHPIQTQAVSYVVQRYASLATALYVLAVVLYVRWRLAREAGGARGVLGALAYAPVLCAALLAMKTKEIAFTLPFVVAIYEACFFEGSWRKRLVYLAPVLATAVVIPLAVLGAARPVGELLSDVTEVTRVQTAASRWDYLVTQVAVVASYLRLLVLPVGQSVDHDVPWYRSLLEPRVAVSILVLAALAGAAAWLCRASRPRGGRPGLDPATRLVSFGIAWFFVALLVESSVIPIVDVLFEHRVYLPSVGFFLSAATALGLLARRLAPARPARATVAIGAIVATALAAVTYRRNDVWASELALWTDAVEKAPSKARPRNNLGVALGRLGRREEAVRQLEEAVRLDPRYVRAHDNLGVVLSDLGRPGLAERHLLLAIELAPDFPDPFYNLGTLYLDESRYGEAAALLQRAIALRPAYRDAQVNLAAAWNALGRHVDVVRLLEGARPLLGGRPEARLHLGLAYGALGDTAAAQRELGVLQGLSPAMARQLQGYLERRTPGAVGGPSPVNGPVSR